MRFASAALLPSPSSSHCSEYIQSSVIVASNSLGSQDANSSILISPNPWPCRAADNAPAGPKGKETSPLSPAHAYTPCKSFMLSNSAVVGSRTVMFGNGLTGKGRHGGIRRVERQETTNLHIVSLRFQATITDLAEDPRSLCVGSGSAPLRRASRPSRAGTEIPQLSRRTLSKIEPARK